MNLGSRIRSLRKEKGWSQQELADVLEISSQVVSNWERTTNAPDHKTIIQLAGLFDVSTDYLLGISNIRKSNLTFETDRLDLERMLVSSNNVYLNNRLLSHDDLQMCLELMKVAVYHIGIAKKSS